MACASEWFHQATGLLLLLVGCRDTEPGRVSRRPTGVVEEIGRVRRRSSLMSMAPTSHGFRGLWSLGESRQHQHQDVTSIMYAQCQTCNQS
ncbi:hypothetical protein BJF79_08585 [Actinomadura sp. CNU-125]|nr:hypothetical protein BJF79_08585 [Actinomadura sp. CNU-125]